jgi:hypothetical protein
MDYLSGVPGIIPWPVGKFVTEAELGLPAGDLTFRQRHDRRCDALAKNLLNEGTAIYTSFMRRGDFLAWASLTPHFSLPSSPFPRRRLSLQVLIRPTHHRWGTFDNQPEKWFSDPAEQVSDRFAFVIK